MKIYTADRGQLYVETAASPVRLAHWSPGPRSVQHFVSASPAQRLAWQPPSDTAPEDPPVAGDHWQPPLAAPRKILCVGRNYAAHAAELDAETPTEPLIFSKLPSALIGHGDQIRRPAASSQIDFEAELVAVIGTGGQHIAEQQALAHVAGYTCGNDVTARDWQKSKPGGQWLLGKSFDTFAPLGPCFVTADEISDPQDLTIQLRLNGQVMQQAHTGDMLFSVRQLIAYVSQVCTLEPGDLIFTGTPAGVGAGRQPAVFLQPGDEVTVEIERIGRLTNTVV